MLLYTVVVIHLDFEDVFVYLRQGHWKVKVMCVRPGKHKVLESLGKIPV